ncbi:MAG TPA: glycosyltransferase family 1 protein [Candidatus Eisenbacteria bacterium]|nr:glycosyltransferase family 1 protein [Candidatus Eisenbacteria bacterium]
MPRPLRVAIDLRPLALEHVTGVGQVILQILEELGAEGVAFTGLAHRPVPEGRIPDGIPVLHESGSGGRIRWESAVLPRLLRAVEPAPDLHHATWNHGVPRNAPVPSVLTVHDVIPWVRPDLVPWPRPGWLHRSLYRGAVRVGVRRAARVTADSAATLRDLVARVPGAAAKAEVVPVALPRWYRPHSSGGGAEAARARWNEGRPYWLYLGGFDPRKGVPDLLGAISVVGAEAETGPVPTLLLPGGLGPLATEYEARARAEGVDARFPGYVEDRDLPSLFAGASLFLYPSRYEGFGIPLLFAMASGVPVVASDAGSIPEIVGDAGRLYPAGDVRALAGLLREASGTRDFGRDAAALGLERVRGFSLERFRERMLRVYEEAASRRGGSA